MVEYNYQADATKPYIRMDIHQMVSQAIFVAPNATLLGDISLGEETSIWYGAVVRADKDRIEVGPRSNIQDNCVIHTSSVHPVRIGRNVSVGHGAILHGCTIEDDVLVGMGAIILNGAVIGEGSIVGAGALVSEGKQIPPHSLVLGVPGRVVREVTDEECSGTVHNSNEYVKLARRYAGE